MTYDPDHRDQAIAALEAEHPGCSEAVRWWLAGEDLAEARRGRYEDTYRLATGTLTAQKSIRNVHVLMDALADDQVWLLAKDPETWRLVMIDCLIAEFHRFCTLVEGAWCNV